MGNELLKKADFEAIADSIAKQYQIILAAVGLDGDSNTFNKGAANCKADVLQHTTDDSNLWLAADMGDAVETYVDAATMGAYFIKPATDILRAIERHAAKRGTDITDINDYLQDIGTRVHPYLRTIYGNIATENTWPLTSETTTGTLDSGNEVADMAVYDITGAATGSITSGTAINTAVYGDSLIKVVVTGGAIGAGSDLVVSIVGKDFDGSTVTASQTVAAGAAENTEYDIATIRFAEITSITHTNGTNGDQLTIRARDDRSPAL